MKKSEPNWEHLAGAAVDARNMLRGHAIPKLDQLGRMLSDVGARGLLEDVRGVVVAATNRLRFSLKHGGQKNQRHAASR